MPNNWQKRKLREKSVSNKRLLKEESIVKSRLKVADMQRNETLQIVQHEVRPIQIRVSYTAPMWEERLIRENPYKYEAYQKCIKRELMNAILESTEFEKCIQFIRLPDYTLPNIAEYIANMRIVPLLPHEKEDSLCF